MGHTRSFQHNLTRTQFAPSVDLIALDHYFTCLDADPRTLVTAIYRNWIGRSN